MPICERATDGCRLLDLSGTVIFKCRCEAPFPNMLRAVGIGRSNGTVLTITPRLDPPAPVAAVVDPMWTPTATWTVHGPDGSSTRTRLESPGLKKRVVWPAGAHADRSRYLWVPDKIRLTDRDLVVCEGEKAGEAAAALGLAAVGTCSGDSGQPDTAVWVWLVAGAGMPRTVLLWPDADDVGDAHMARVAARLAGLWPDGPILVIDPAAVLGTDPPPGWDAADWDPSDAVDVDEWIARAAVKWSAQDPPAPDETPSAAATDPAPRAPVPLDAFPDHVPVPLPPAVLALGDHGTLLPVGEVGIIAGAGGEGK